MSLEILAENVHNFQGVFDKVGYYALSVALYSAPVLTAIAGAVLREIYEPEIDELQDERPRFEL
jgi:hypothetical protein